MRRSTGCRRFQQPPTSACDVGALRALLEALPVGIRAAFEFRHASWHRDDVASATPYGWQRYLDAGGATRAAAIA